MKRPWLLRILPTRLQIPVYARLFRGNREKWAPLYKASPLRFAPGISMDLVPGDMLSGAIAFTGMYERQLTRRVAEAARASAGGLMVDVGANIGYFTLLWLGCNPHNRAIAFEPSTRIAEILRRNLRRNGVEDRVTVHEVAVGAENGRMAFDPGPKEQTGCGSLIPRPNERSTDVDVVRLDQVLGGAGKVDFLKIDAEGADTLVLYGAKRLLEEKMIGEIWYEQLKWMMAELSIEPNSAQDFLRAQGYDPVAQVDANGGRTEWSAVPRR